MAIDDGSCANALDTLADPAVLGAGRRVSPRPAALSGPTYPDRHAILAGGAGGNFIHWLLLPAFLTLALGLWQRRRMTLLFSAVNIAAFVWLFGALFLPQEAPAAASDARALTVMTYNINTGNATPDRLIPVLRESGADIIGLVEIRADQQAAIEQTLADEYPYRVFYGSGIPGMG
jgi:endonuclease/exonuclease/phosphatase (EEP) superfamily protein YafD